VLLRQVSGWKAIAPLQSKGATLYVITFFRRGKAELCCCAGFSTGEPLREWKQMTLHYAFGFDLCAVGLQYMCMFQNMEG